MSIFLTTKKKDILHLVFYMLAAFPLLDYGISAILLGAFVIINLYVNGVRITSLWFFIAFFLYLLIISFVFSGFYETSDRLSNSYVLIVIPILISSIDLKNKELIKFSNTYITVIVFKCLVCLLLFFIDKSFFTGADIPFLSTEFHATYFSYEVIIAVLLVYYLFKNKYKNFLLIFFSIVIILFQKKIAILALILFWIFHIKRFIKNHILLLIPIIPIIIYIKTNYLAKIKLLINTSLKFNLLGEDRVRLRLLEACWYNFVEAPFFGKGVVEHTKFFSEYNLKHLGVWSQDYNTHNYFLFVLCSGGVIALFFFLFPYLFFIKKSIKKCKIFLFFLIISMIFNLTESLLDRYNGALTFALFSLFFFKYYSNNEKFIKHQ